VGANIGTISRGQAVTRSPRAELLVERRSLEQAELDAFAEKVRPSRVEEPLRLECEIVGRRTAGRTDPSDPLVRLVVAARRTLGLGEYLRSGSTDANAAAALGIPAVALGWARGSGMHTRHERIDLESLEPGVRQLVAVILSAIGNRYAGTAGETRARDYMPERFKALGLADVRLESFDYLAYERGSAPCALIGPGGGELECHPPQYTATGQVSGEGIYLGDAAEADFERIEARGVDLVPLPSTSALLDGCKPSAGFVLGVSCSAATRRLLRPRHPRFSLAHQGKRCRSRH
jgi:Peptidase family M20/M25/M40